MMVVFGAVGMRSQMCKIALSITARKKRKKIKIKIKIEVFSLVVPKSWTNFIRTIIS